MEMLRFDEKTVLITGAAAGIGRACARQFAGQGANVVLTDIQEKQVQEAAETIQRETGSRTLALVCDVSDPVQVKETVKKAVDVFGTIDVLVSNAGGTHGAVHCDKVEDYTDQEFDQVVRLNLYGMFFFCREVVPVMKKHQGGSIVIVSSGAGRTTSRSEVGRIPYSGSKAGQLGMMRQLALENAADNIRVNAVAPGLIASTDYINRNWEENSDEVKEQTLAKIPLHRRGTSEEVANGILFLASEEAGYITGHCLDINGGFIMM